MSTNGDTQENSERTRQRLIALLEEMSGEDLDVIEKFAMFIWQQGGQSVVAVVEREGEMPYQYPTVPVPASSLGKWSTLLDRGYEGDALADTEALYDDD
jgi:hypothetical protein